MALQIKSRKDVLSDVIKDASDHPTNWKAVFGRDVQRMSTDYYLFHPDVGLYLVNMRARTTSHHSLRSF